MRCHALSTVESVLNDTVTRTPAAAATVVKAEKT